ncbi:MAG: acyl-CoA dehydratase activase [Tissierella sp.]|uniref:acyl-CoA dehydratase activase n=1 Tax=Tissierella sp. TaxID=41274 RepID=UPI003F9E0397
MYYVGIDIGSTATKVSVFKDDKLKENYNLKTGWSSLEVSKEILEILEKDHIKKDDMKVIATGYGRISVPYANKQITEITCHAKGVDYLIGKDSTIIDIGGQDTKIISLKNGIVTDFTMNDKCAAGTGKFMELMSNTLGVSIDEMCKMALSGEDISISSMCTVFAESEVISLIGSGKDRESISRGIVNSITERVSSMLFKHGARDEIYLTGGLCEVEDFKTLLSEKIEIDIKTDPLARYAGSIGAALLAQNLK